MKDKTITIGTETQIQIEARTHENARRVMSERQAAIPQRGVRWPRRGARIFASDTPTRKGRKVSKALIARAKRTGQPLYHAGKRYEEGLVSDKLARRVMRKQLAEGRGFKRKIRDAHREIADLRGLAPKTRWGAYRPTPHQQRRLIENFMDERRAAREAQP